MDIDIRNSIFNNLHGANHDEIENTIKDAIQGGDEITLPGLGVLFESLWSKSSDVEKNTILDKLVAALQ